VRPERLDTFKKKLIHVIGSQTRDLQASNIGRQVNITDDNVDQYPTTAAY
jgi:hypothetical protein